MHTLLAVEIDRLYPYICFGHSARGLAICFHLHTRHRMHVLYITRHTILDRNFTALEMRHIPLCGTYSCTRFQCETYICCFTPAGPSDAITRPPPFTLRVRNPSHSLRKKSTQVAAPSSSLSLLRLPISNLLSDTPLTYG